MYLCPCCCECLVYLVFGQAEWQWPLEVNYDTPAVADNMHSVMLPRQSPYFIMDGEVIWA